MNERQKHPKRPRDINARAATTVAWATGQLEEEIPEVAEVPEITPEESHNAAVALGRKGGKARAKALAPQQRQEIAKKAAAKRWRQSPQ